MTERITPEQIANVRRLNEGRTQGPWLVDGPSASVVAASGRIIAKVATFLRHGSYMATVEDDTNQAFIAAAANLIIPALDEIERLQRITADGAYPIEQLRQQVVYLYPDMTGVDRAGERLRSRMAAVQRWHQEALAPPPAHEEGVSNG